MSLYPHESKIIVRYAETDQMGFVYYGNYATYFEVARVEWMKQFGVAYAEMEKQGILMPVVHFSIDYKKPAFYDETLTIKVSIEEFPKHSIVFVYQTFNAKEELLNKAKTTLVFLNKENMRLTKAPEILIKNLKKA